MFTHKLGKSYTTDAGTISSLTQTFQAQGEVRFDGVIEAGTTNREVDVAFVKSKMVSVMLYSDQAVTVKTNSSSSPQETITLAAKQMVEWATTGHHEACPFADDVTKFFVTNSGQNAANFKIAVLVELEGA